MTMPLLEEGFDRGIDEADRPRDPGRRIAITPTVIALDEAQRKARAKPITWQRPAAAKPIEWKESPIVKVRAMTHKPQPPRGRQENMRFSNCAWCEVRLSVGEMEKHKPVCKKRPKQ